MKIKDYFLKLKEQGKIKNEDYDKFVETVPEGEMPDALFPILEDTFLTKERALAHKEISGPLWSKALDPIDNDIKEILKYLPAEVVIDIEKQDSTYKKMGAVKSGIQLAIQKASKSPTDEESKKKLAEAQNAMHELTEKFTKLNSEREQEKKTLQADYENKIKGFRLDTHLESLVNSYTFADSYKETRNTLTKAMLGEIKAANKLDLVEKDGKLDIHILGEDGAPRFEGNTPVTISKLLDSTFKPFLKVNNADEGNGQRRQETQQHRVDDPNPSIRRGANTSVQI